MHFCLKNSKIMITDKDYNFEESLLLNDPIEVYRCEYIEFPSSDKIRHLSILFLLFLLNVLRVIMMKIIYLSII